MITDEDLRRLFTWAGAIAQHFRPESPVALTPEGLRLGRRGSLAISATDGWFNHEIGTGGPDALSLIRHLRKCTEAEATAWARDWLARNPGDGQLTVDGDAEMAAEARERRAAFARQILEEASDPAGTPAETYLRGRGLEPPYPQCAWIADARLGEGAVIGILTNPEGEVAGAQVAYLDPDGRKSTIPPQRQLYLLDRESAEQAGFRISVAEPSEYAVSFVLAEGLEDGLSIAQAGMARQVIALPGVGRFAKLDLPPGAEVVVFRDGDAADSPAAKQLTESVDRWLLAGVRVRVTATPEGADANSILQERGAEDIRQLIAEAPPAELSLDADIARLAALDASQYEKERNTAAKRHGVRVSFLDAAAKAARAEAQAATTEEDEDEAPHPEPVADIGVVLDQALAELQRYVVGAEPELAAAVLWCLHAHLVHHERVWLPVSPKLAIQAPDRNCGKSTLLEIIGALTPRPETGSSVTASVVFRLIEARKPTLLIDEADRIVRVRGGSEELLAVLNSSHRRSGAYVWRTEEIGGERVPVKFSTWAACAFAGIRELPPTLQDRSIVIRLRRAKPGEVQAHLRHGTSPALRITKQKFARWAADLMQLPEPQLPAGLHNRAGDNWQVLIVLAALGGGRWPQLVRGAAVASLAADQQESIMVALLDGIRRAFGEQERLGTRAMLDFLLADDEYDWTTANNGRAINEALLRERLRGVIAPGPDGKPGSEQWRSGKIRERGYSRSRFLDAFQRYLPLKSPENTRDSVDIRDTSSNPPERTGKSVTDAEATIRDVVPHPGQDNSGGTHAKSRHGYENRHPRRKKRTKSNAVTDVPGVTHDSGDEKVIPAEGEDDAGIALPASLADGELGPEEIL